MKKWFHIEITLVRYRTGKTASTRSNVISSSDATSWSSRNTLADFYSSHTGPTDRVKGPESKAELTAKTDICEGTLPRHSQPSFCIRRRLLAFVERLWTC